MSDLNVSVKLQLAAEQFNAAITAATQNFSQSMGGMNQSAKSAGDGIEQAFKTLGVTSFSSVEAEISKLKEAYATLAKNGAVSAQELDAAWRNMSRGVASLQESLVGTGKSLEGAFGVIGIRSIKAINAEIGQVNSALDNLKKSGASMDEIARATDAAAARVKALKAEAGEIPPALTKAQAAAKGMADAFASLNIRSIATINAEIGQVSAALDNLKKSGASMDEISRASNAASARISALRAEAGMLAPGFDLAGKSASAGIGKIKEASDQAAPPLSALQTSLGGVVSALAALAASVGAVSLIKSFAQAGINYNATLETTQLGIASLIAAQGDLHDSQGKLLTGTDMLNAAQTVAAGQLQKLKIAGLQTSATFIQLAEAYQVAVGAGMSAGLSLDQIRTLTVQITQAAGALGVPMHQINQEVQSILAGTIDQNSRVAKSLGLSNEEVNTWKAKNTLAAEMTKRLQVFSEMGARIANTWTAVKSNIGEARDTIAGIATAGMFDELKKSLNTLFNVLIDSVKGEVRPEMDGLISSMQSGFTALGKEIGSWVDGFTSGLKDASEWLKKNKAYVEETAGSFKLVWDQVRGLLGDLSKLPGAVGEADKQTGALAKTMQVVSVFIGYVRDGVAALKIAFSIFASGAAGLLESLVRGMALLTFGKAKEELLAVADSLHAAQKVNFDEATASMGKFASKGEEAGKAIEKLEAEVGKAGKNDGFKLLQKDIDDFNKKVQSGEYTQEQLIVSAAALQEKWKGMAASGAVGMADVEAATKKLDGTITVVGKSSTALDEALKTLKVDTGHLGGGVSDFAIASVNAFDKVASSAGSTGSQIRAALEGALENAKFEKDLLAIQTSLVTAAGKGKIFGDELARAIADVEAKARELAGQIEGPLGDSFKRLGIKSAESLRTAADQAKVDYDRIKASGTATALELEKAHQKMADAVKAAFSYATTESLRALEAERNHTAALQVSASAASAKGKALEASATAQKADADYANASAEANKTGSAAARAKADALGVAAVAAHDAANAAEADAKASMAAAKAAEWAATAKQAEAIAADAPSAANKAAAGAAKNLANSYEKTAESSKQAAIGANKIATESGSAAKAAGTLASGVKDVEKSSGGIGGHLNEANKFINAAHQNFKEVGISADEVNEMVKHTVGAFMDLKRSMEEAVKLWARSVEAVENQKRAIKAAVNETQLLTTAAATVTDNFNRVKQAAEDLAMGMKDAMDSAGGFASASSDPKVNAELQKQNAAVQALAKAYDSIKRAALSAAKSAEDAVASFVASSGGIHEELLTAQGKEQEASDAQFASRKRQLEISYRQLQVQIQIAEVQARAAKVDTADLEKSKSDAAAAYTRDMTDLDALAKIDAEKRKTDAAKRTAEEMTRKAEQAAQKAALPSASTPEPPVLDLTRYLTAAAPSAPPAPRAAESSQTVKLQFIAPNGATATATVGGGTSAQDIINVLRESGARTV